MSSHGVATDEENYTAGNSGCSLATRFLGRPSHCLTLDENNEPIPDQSCPFPECHLYLGRMGGGYQKRIKILTSPKLV